MSHVASKMLSCRMSNLRNVLCSVTIYSGHFDKLLCCMSILRNGRAAVSTLGVKGHLIGGFEGGGGGGVEGTIFRHIHHNLCYLYCLVLKQPSRTTGGNLLVNLPLYLN